MNREETKKAIEVMQAYVDGKEIEAWERGVFSDTSNPAWGWDVFDYRIKPEPLTLWVNEYKDNEGKVIVDAFTELWDAEINRRTNGRTIKMIEVKEDR